LLLPPADVTGSQNVLASLKEKRERKNRYHKLLSTKRKKQRPDRGDAVSMQLLIISRLHILTMVLIKIGKTIIEVHWGLHEGRDCDIDFASRSPIALVVVPCFNFHNLKIRKIWKHSRKGMKEKKIVTSLL